MNTFKFFYQTESLELSFSTTYMIKFLSMRLKPNQAIQKLNPFAASAGSIYGTNCTSWGCSPIGGWKTS